MQRALALPTVAVALLLLTSCTPSPAAETPTTSPSTTADAPIFETEEEAVAAADEVIQQYWTTTNEVFQSGGLRIEKLESIVTERRMQSERQLADSFQEQQLVQTGNFRAEATSFQQMFNDDDTTVLIVTTCVDSGEVEARFSDGRLVQRISEEPRYLHEVTLHVTANGSDLAVRLDESEPWTDFTC
ncbi:MAG: hypothetical protein IR160_04335 [Salinibacterium sp.]|nr:hypothetical protein [Salinibacterium sp.]MBF0671796.1 hypothetical protein [Salinibacterium sp.]